MVILRTLISRYTLNKCFVYFKKDLLQFNTKYVHRYMYGWLWNRILFGLNNISAGTANHYIKDKMFQDIINQVPYKNNTLVSIVLDSLWHLLKKMTKLMITLIQRFRFLTRNV